MRPNAVDGLKYGSLLLRSTNYDWKQLSFMLVVVLLGRLETQLPWSLPWTEMILSENVNMMNHRNIR